MGDRAAEEQRELESIPDGWIIIDEKQAIVLETKIKKNSVKQDQLLGHTQRIRDYPQKFLCVITPDEESRIKDLVIKDVRCEWISWKDIYGLMNSRKASRDLSEYFRKQLKEYLLMKEDLIGFQGIDGSEEFDPAAAKRTLKNLVSAIKPDILETYPELKFVRSKYTSEIQPHTVHHRSVWTYFAPNENFVKNMHLTLWLTETHLGIAVTVSNSAKKEWKRLKEIFNSEEQFSVFKDKLLHLRKKLPCLYLEFVHRHYLHQQDPFVDGIIEIDLDTVKGSKLVKQYSRWLDAMRELVANKRGFNGQLMIRSRYFYADHPQMRDAKFKDTVVKAARHFKDIYDYLN